MVIFLNMYVYFNTFLLIGVEQDLIDHVTQNGAHYLCNEKCGNGNVHRWFINPDGTDNMKTIIVPFDGLEINVIHSRHGHGEGKSVLNTLFLGLDVEILESNPVNRKKNLFGVMKKNIHFAPLLVRMIILKNLVCACLGFVKDHGTPHKPITYRDLVLRIDMDHNTVVWEVRNGGMP